MAEETTKAATQKQIATFRRRMKEITQEMKIFHENGKRAILSEATIQNIMQFRGMLKALEDYYVKFDDLWQMLAESCELIEVLFPAKEDTDFKALARDYYFSCHTSLQILNAKEKSAATNASFNTTFNEEGRSNNKSLPKIQLPSFDGKDLSNWAQFRDTFTSMIHNDLSLNIMDKFYYLRTALQDDARKVVTQFALEEANYPLAWQALLDNYDNPRMLASSYLDAILNYKPLSEKNSAEILNNFMSKVSDNISSFRLLKITEEAEFILFHIAEKCLDAQTRELFEMAHKDVKFPTIKQLVKFVKERATVLRFAADSYKSSSSNKSTNSSPQKTTSNKSGPPKAKNYPKKSLHVGSKSKTISKQNVTYPLCFVCKAGNHHLLSCEKFHCASAKDRIQMLKGWTGCLNCLNSAHTVNSCSSKWSCRFCMSRHHNSLHDSNTPQVQASPVRVSHLTAAHEFSSQEEMLNGTSLQTTVEHECPSVLGTALAEIMDAQGKFQTIRMAIDSCSEDSFVTQKCLSRLGLDMIKLQKRIIGIGQTPFDGVKGRVSCTLRPRLSRSMQFSSEAIVVENITSYLPSSIIPQNIRTKCAVYKLADPNFWKPGPIDFLLGVDLFAQIFTGSTVSLDDPALKLFSTVFGFVLIGKVSNNKSLTSTSLFTIQQSEDLNKQLRHFWEIEELPDTRRTSNPEDILSESHFLNTHYREPDGRYVVRLPFREETPNLGDSSFSALRRFHSLEKKWKAQPEVGEKYKDFMQEYLDTEHMELATSPSLYIIPHHCVVKQIENNDIKLRVVFDGSAQTSFGSLNEHLLTGEKLHLDIRDLLLKFRRHPIAFTTDIVKMFRMIKVDKSDRQYLHIYWRFDQSQSVQTYELKTVTYGLVCAPFLALRAIKQLVVDEGEQYPLAAEVLLNDIYVDDFLTGSSSISQALELQKQLIALLGAGGFQLSKWASNSKEIMQAVFKGSAQSDPVSFSSLEDTCIKVLGLQWDSSADEFTFSIKTPEPASTKRALLSTVARLYDPLGFLAPTTLIMKSFIQELWKLQLDWDDPIPSSLQNQWNTITQQLCLLENVRIPRYLGPTCIAYQVVGFSDASIKGYAAVLYMRVICADYCRVYLLTAKCKLAPTKTLTIPRLELSGALLLAKLYESINPLLKVLSQPIMSPVFYSDSTIVLGWLSTPSYKLHTFVANRIIKILELTTLNSWKHVVSEDNPADPASRGLLPSDLVDHPVWWNGPTWLTQDQINWPISTVSALKDLPKLKPNPQATLTVSKSANPLVNWMTKFSSFHTMVRAAGWLYRWMYNSKHVGCCCCNMHIGTLQRKEYEEGLKMCIKATQNTSFPSSHYVEKQYASLKPFLDPDGIWRVGGRLRHATIPEAQKHPILLPAQAHFTIILVDFLHKIYNHPGPTTLQALIQMRYWIPSLRRLIRQRGFHCLRCYKSRAPVINPIMADLPKYRVNGGRAFLHTGVDFAGPFLMKESARRKAVVGKVYLCLYVCMATKAIHLEVVTRLTTEGFIASFERFTSRRGLPSDVYSDNGTNFLGAANYFKDLYSWLLSPSHKQDITDYAMKTQFDWHFNPPRTPHMGGIWEAGVKSVKTRLMRIASNTPMTFEELTTVFARIEAILNSRPLCPLSSSPEETKFLSPGHFLVGGPLLSLPEPTLLNTKESSLSRWQLVTRMSQEFWKRWRLEYLSTLQKRPKWFKASMNWKVGDLVLLRNESPPLQWPTAKVIEVFPGSDGVIRVVTVQTTRASYKRPVVNLVPLLPLSYPAYNN